MDSKPPEPAARPYINPSERIDWLTPPEEVEGVVLPVLGEVDLDCTANAAGYVPARERYFGTGPGDDGYAADWSGRRVFLQPNWSEHPPVDPRTRKRVVFPCWHGISEWVQRATFAGAGDSTVLGLLPAATERRWFQLSVRCAAAVCFLERRIAFHLPELRAAKGSPGDGQVYILWTNDAAAIQRFAEVLRLRGLVYGRY